MNSDTYLEKIGNLIQENRIMRGWTQAKLAKALDTSQSAINRIEKRRTKYQPRNDRKNRRSAS